MADKKHPIFVYGTLKRGEGNHRLLEGQEFVGVFKTAPKYRMFDCGWYPCLKEAFDDGISVEGELYRVDAATLRRLDILEGISSQLYKRDSIELVGATEPVQAYFYLDSVRGMKECGERWARRTA